MFDRRLAEFARDFADETRLWRREALPIIAINESGDQRG
jgi:hypothetical protein